MQQPRRQHDIDPTRGTRGGQLPPARNVQHTIVVLDDIADRFMVALDEADDDLALKTAVFALLRPQT